MSHESWARVTVPSNHSTILSFRYFLMSIIRSPCSLSNPRRVEIYSGHHKGKGNLIWKICHYDASMKRVAIASLFTVFFSQSCYGAGQQPHSGFQLHLSFHKPSDPMLQQTPSGLWNCSVPYWADFQLHFPCDLVQECVGGEDEKNCPYTGHCGQGRLTIGERCYQYIEKGENPVSWIDANMDCAQKGGYLASLNTRKEWQDVLTLLRQRKAFWKVHIGLMTMITTFPNIYSGLARWADQTTAFYASYFVGRIDIACGFFSEQHYYSAVISTDCLKSSVHSYMCEEDQPKKTHSIHIPPPVNMSLPFPAVECPKRHIVHQFLACEALSDCWPENSVTGDSDSMGHNYVLQSSCSAPLSLNPPSFRCRDGVQRVSYSLVCDHKTDCADRSDEHFCTFPPCADGMLHCDSLKQCIQAERICDGQKDCHYSSDENNCKRVYKFFSKAHPFFNAAPSPAVLDLNPKRYDNHSVTMKNVKAADENGTRSLCPESHFQCADNGYCLPVYLRCNGYYDCPNHEDEADCFEYTCPGFYRCHGSSICLHALYLCDGLYQCPHKDDEFFCHLTCPSHCVCNGLAFRCDSKFETEQTRNARYLDISYSGLSPDLITGSTMLIFLSMAHCNLPLLSNLTFANLHVLDVSHNQIRAITVSHLDQLPSLQVLVLADNPLTASHVFSDTSSKLFHNLEVLDLSFTRMREITPTILKSFPNIISLNLSHSDVDVIQKGSLQTVIQLRSLDMTGCPMHHIRKELFEGLGQLRSIYADNYKLCCPAMLPPGFNINKCHAPFNVISSCNSLLHSDVYRIVLSAFCCFSLLGNACSFIIRMFDIKEGNDNGFSVMVAHLSLSDFLMGLYLAILGVADRLYMDRYLWEDSFWRHSRACMTAGFLSLTSNEVSAFLIFLITLDRFLALRFPFSGLRFSKKSAMMGCCLAWTVGMLMAAVPLLPWHLHWNFYSQTGTCLPLPITKRYFDGHSYAFGVMIVFNFALCLLIASGQIVIIFSVRADSVVATATTHKARELKVARRLISVAISDFACCFPIALLGVLSSQGLTISGEVNVAMAIIVLPLNSALNPFLYNLNVWLEKRRKAHEESILKSLIKQSEDED